MNRRRFIKTVVGVVTSAVGVVAIGNKTTAPEGYPISELQFWPRDHFKTNLSELGRQAGESFAKAKCQMILPKTKPTIDNMWKEYANDYTKSHQR
jgi:hypothetical protein